MRMGGEVVYYGIFPLGSSDRGFGVCVNKSAFHTEDRRLVSLG